MLGNDANPVEQLPGNGGAISEQRALRAIGFPSPSQHQARRTDMTRQSKPWISQPDPQGSGTPDINYAGAHHYNFGEEHHHKPTKAIIGVGALIVLSFLLYEINGRSHATRSSMQTPNQTVASSNH
jgi:hypothetical protein